MNIRNGDSLILDDEGCELLDIIAALEEARHCARELAVDRIRSRQALGEEAIEVVTDVGIVGVVSVRATILK
jgi:hypothetical protein